MPLHIGERPAPIQVIFKLSVLKMQFHKLRKANAHILHMLRIVLARIMVVVQDGVTATGEKPLIAITGAPHRPHRAAELGVLPLQVTVMLQGLLIPVKTAVGGYLPTTVLR